MSLNQLADQLVLHTCTKYIEIGFDVRMRIANSKLTEAVGRLPACFLPPEKLSCDANVLENDLGYVCIW